MSSLNEVRLIGRIGKEPEVAKTNEGKPILKFSLATTDRWTDKTTSEKKEKTEWHRIVIYNNPKLCEILEQQKETLVGALVLVSGKIRYEKWVNQSGVEQRATSIVIDSFSGQISILLRRNKNGQENHEAKKPTSHNSETDCDFSNFEFASEESDEIPF
ncbi:single-stranded DNA-binding protein [Alphaproteobacteria bacterium endosymbiont of Tiliacea citrago]|uniref:single-stranded DNA-binding protein n=1 Tax=Alphaproteobacteria bacterium endosymbiont of Tiliacea citrago TaxID=3077944 RepID=UPI00313C00A5